MIGGRAASAGGGFSGGGGTTTGTGGGGTGAGAGAGAGGCGAWWWTGAGAGGCEAGGRIGAGTNGRFGAGVCGLGAAAFSGLRLKMMSGKPQVPGGIGVILMSSGSPISDRGTIWIGAATRCPAAVTLTSVEPSASGQKTPRGSSTTCPVESSTISGRPRDSRPRRAATNRAIRGVDDANAMSVGTVLLQVSDHHTHWSSGSSTPV